MRGKWLSNSWVSKMVFDEISLGLFCTYSKSILHLLNMVTSMMHFVKPMYIKFQSHNIVEILSYACSKSVEMVLHPHGHCY